METRRRQATGRARRPLDYDLAFGFVDPPASPKAHDVGFAPGNVIIGQARAVSPDGRLSAGSLSRVHRGRGFEVKSELRCHGG